MVKISVLQHAQRHYPGGLLFVDTDTIWLADPAPLFAEVAQGRHVMHLSEGRLASGNLLNRKVYQHLQPYTFPVGNQWSRLTPQTVLYNSGRHRLRPLRGHAATRHLRPGRPLIFAL
ncbi:MAG: hypothetical protein WKG07_14525 [Hymenobacter sp.]